MTWVSRGNVAGVESFAGVACNNSGLSIAIDDLGKIYKSTDGGTTWANTGTVGSGLAGQGNIIWDSGSNRWLWGADGNRIAYSDDNGATWVAVNTGLTSAGTGWIVTDGAGHLICIANEVGNPLLFNVSRSPDNGATWANAQYIPLAGVFSAVWDGSQFAIVCADATFTNVGLGTSADGVVWAVSTGGPPGRFGLDINRAAPLLVSCDATNIHKAASAAALVGAAPVAIPGIVASIPFYLNGTWFVFDQNAQTVAVSTDNANTWTNEATGAVAGDAMGFMAYDSAHGTWIAATFGAGPPGGYILTRTAGTAIVPNVVGDTISAAGTSITGVGLTVGVLTYASSLTVARGIVLSQTPVAGNSIALGGAVALVMSTGAPIAAKLTQKLLLWLHHIFDKDPHQQLALRLQYDGGMVWTIANGVLTTVVTGGTGVDLNIDLAGYTIQTLAAYLATSTGYSVPYHDTSSYEALSALVLLDSSNNIGTSNGDHIYGYTTFLWAYLEANGSELATAKAQIPNALAQMNTTTATDEWLDFQGGFYDVPRNQGELDPAYSPRIIASVLQPRGNNVAIATAIQSIATGAQRVRVIDSIDNTSLAITYNGLITFNGAEFYDGGLGPSGANGFFDVDFSFDFTAGVTQATYLGQIESTVEAFRDGGTHLRAVIFRNNGSTILIVSDSFIGGIRVIVYDDFGAADYRLLESGLVRLLENGVDARLLE